jgi:hypothetical protein
MKRRLSRREAIKTALIILGGILVIFLLANIVSFLTTRNRLPHNSYLGDVDISGMSINEAISRTVRSLDEPVALRYQGDITQLTPGQVEFQVNDVVARLQLEKVLRSQQGLDKLPDYMLRRTVNSRTPTPYQYSEAKLDEFLRQIAQAHDQAAKPAQPDLNTLTLSLGQDGMALNMDESRKLVLNALASSNARVIDLPVDVAPGGNTTLQALGELIKARLAPFVGAGNVAGVFVKDLKSGQEFSINADVAFSGRGWLKLAVLVEAFRSAGETASPQWVTTLTTMITDGNANTSNDVLRTLGNGDAQAGVTQLNATLKRMGLVSTFLAQPFDDPGKPPQFITPGNARTDANASPDPAVQATPAEMGALFEMLNQCTRKTGPLPLLFAKEFTPAKCEQVLNTIGQNKANILILAGSPGATVMHRQSWDANNHGDAALVSTPGGVYVLSIMLHSNNTLNWSDTSLMISDIARATYGFYNKGQVPPPVAAMNAAPPQ